MKHHFLPTTVFLGILLSTLTSYGQVVQIRSQCLT